MVTQLLKNSYQRLGGLVHFAVLLLFVTTSSHAADKAFTNADIKDLAYGETLFYFYQNKYFSAITHLTAAQKTNQLTHHKDEAELLLGGLYLSYGLYRDAEKIFQRLIKYAPPAVAARAWFHLAQVHYRLGHYSEAETALDAIKDALPGELGSRRKLLSANIYLAQRKYPAAIAVLKALSGDTIWHHYARYNLGIAYVKNNQTREGEALLIKIGNLTRKEREMLALRDKANLALGYMHLQQKQHTEAIKYFEQVRLKGQFSNPALFGMGQSYAELNQPQHSLKYWTELRERATYGAAVFESMLAVPAALFQLGAHKQALDGYQHANASFKADIERINNAIIGIGSQRLLEELLRTTIINKEAHRPALELPSVFKQHYLTEFLAGHEFNEALKNYQEVGFLQQHLADKTESLTQLETILKARADGFSEQLPRVFAKAAPLLRNNAQERFNKLAQALTDTERTRDITRVANNEEQKILQRLNEFEAKLKALPEDEERKALEGKYQLLRGVLHWRLDAAYLPRMQSMKQSISTLQQAISATSQQHRKLDTAKQANPQSFSLYQQQISTVRSQVIDLQQRASTAADKHEAYIQRLAIARLALQKQRLEGYIHQANFAIAQIYDIAATKDKAK